MKKARINIFYIILMFLFFGLILGTITHELIGHGLTAAITNINNKNISNCRACILFLKINTAGIQISSCLSENAFFGYVGCDVDYISPISYGYTTIMGPTLSLIISLIFSFIILLKKTKGFKKILFSIFTLYFLDPLYNAFKFIIGKGDLLSIQNNLEISAIPIAIIFLLSSIISSLILYYKFKNKQNKKLRKILFWALILISILLFIYLVFFGIQIYRTF